MVQRAGQNLQLLIEKVEILYGNRGNPRDWALRRGELVDVQKIIADVRKSLDDLKKSLQQVKEDIDQINSHIAQLESRLDAAEQAINDLDRELAALEQRIQSAEGALTALERDIEAVNSQVGQIGGDLQSVQLDISHLQNDISQIRSAVGSIESNITDVETDINVLSQQIASIAGQLASVFALHSNPGSTPFTAGIFRAIPFFTPGESTGIVVTNNTTFKVSKAGIYQFELEVRINGGATNMPPVSTPIALSLDTTTVPTGLRAGYSAADDVKSRTVIRLVCMERLAADAQRVAYLFNGGTANYQITSAVMKVVRISA